MNKLLCDVCRGSLTEDCAKWGRSNELNMCMRCVSIIKERGVKGLTEQIQSEKLEERPSNPKELTVKQMVSERLEKDGYDGLYNVFRRCGCLLDDLMSCNEVDDCQPGYRQNIDNCEECSCWWSSCETVCKCVGAEKPKKSEQAIKDAECGSIEEIMEI